MSRDELIHAVAVARQEALPSRWCDLDEDEQRAMIELVEGDLAVLDRLLPGLSDVIDGKAVVMPRDPTAKQVDDIASNIRGSGFSGDSFVLARVCFDVACRTSPYKEKP